MKESLDVMSYFGVNEETGLSPEQFKKNLEKYGYNGEGEREMDVWRKQLDGALEGVMKE